MAERLANLCCGHAACQGIVRGLLKEAWGDGYEGGHEDARAVQKTYPEPTPNPYEPEEAHDD